jgi:hypothetical protein
VNYAGSPCEVHHREGAFGPSSLLVVLGTLRFLRLRICAGKALKKERDRHVQCLAQLIEAAGADRVFGLLVFVQLLVSDTQGCGKFWLAYTQFSAQIPKSRRKSGPAPSPLDPSRPVCDPRLRTESALTIDDSVAREGAVPLAAAGPPSAATTPRHASSVNPPVWWWWENPLQASRPKGLGAGALMLTSRRGGAGPD